MSSFLLFCFLITFSYSYDQQSNILCARHTEVSTPVLHDDPYYFPLNWNENKSVPTYGSNQMCQWIVRISYPYYVLFTMNADIGGDSLLNITDTNGKSEIIMTSEQQPYVFVGDNFTIDLTIGPNGNLTSFGFEVQWMNFPSVNATQYDVSKNQSELVYDAILFDNGQLITAETRVSIIAFPSFWPDFTTLLRLSLVFDGPNITSPYIGNLYQAVRSTKPFTSTGNQLTVYTFEDDYSLGPDYIAMDYYNVKNINEMKGITCMSNASCPITLNAMNGPASSMTLNIDDGDEFIKRLDLSDDAVLKVYIGTRKEDSDYNLIASYNSEQSKTNLPQKFNGAIMTYYLEKGTAMVELAEDFNYTRWNDAVVGRQGFITSSSFGYASIGQNTYDYIGGLETNELFSFTINITSLDISSGSILTIGFGKESGIKEYVFSSENPSQSTILTEISGNMTVQYITNSTESRGFYLDFKIGNAISFCSYASTFTVFITTLLILF